MKRLPHDWYCDDVPWNVAISDGAWLYSTYAFRHFRSRRTTAVRIGRDSGVYDGTYFDLGPEGEVLIGDFCTIVGAIVSGDVRVEVHDYSFVAHEVVIADSVWAVPPDREDGVRPSAASREPIVLGENCWIGARAILLPGARIGRDAIVGAGAVVDFEVPDGGVAVGNPGRVATSRATATHDAPRGSS